MPAQTFMVIETNDIDLKTTGLTVLVPVMAGRYFLLTRAWLEFRTLTSATGNPIGKILGNHTTAGVIDMCESRSFDRTVGLQAPIHFTPGDGSTRYIANLNDPVSVSITTGATGTTVRGDIIVEGILI
jgi:hypothetical protein